MARLGRVAVPGYCYHATHRGNRRSRIFCCEEDRDVYGAFLQRYVQRFGLSIRAWRLMGNHVHLVVEPANPDSLSQALGQAHGKYAQWFNAQYGLSGHLWSGRFCSTAQDGPHLWAAVRHVELNAVRAGLVNDARDWPWSSARAHCPGTLDALLTAGGPLTLGEAWSQWLARGIDDATLMRLRRSTHTGRPCGDLSFVEEFERKLNRLLQPQKPGPKPAASSTITEDLFA